jgi:hypothetical protein
MGYNWKDLKKGVYKDGHEREDVVNYRVSTFLPRIKALEPYMATWIEHLPATGPDPGVTTFTLGPPIGPLPPGQRPIIEVTHDEASFSSKDGVRSAWVQKDSLPFFDKGRGKCIMVSEYLTPGGNLQLPVDATDLPLDSDGDQFRECTEIVECTDGRSYWKSEDVVNQLRNLALPLFEKAYPGYQALFYFDNATNHAAYAPDALRAELMNLGPGGKQPVIRNGFNPLTQSPQNMQDMNGIPKGMKQILQERGLWRAGLLTQCKIENPNKAAKSKRINNPECLRPREEGQELSCCARAILSGQADFKASRSQIEEIVEQAGHLVIFYPKFHPELNWIEYYWGACKYFARRHCNYSFIGLREIVPKALESVSPSLIHKYWARSKRILNSYYAGAVYGDEQFREHVYRSHRKISSSGESSTRGATISGNSKRNVIRGG